MTASGADRLSDLIAAVKSTVDEAGDAADLVEGCSLGERANAMVELFNDGEYEYIKAFVPTDHIHDMRLVHVPGMGIYRGQEEYANFIREWTEAFPEAKLELEHEFVITRPAEAIFAVYRQEVRGGASDVPVVFRYAMLAEHSDQRHDSLFGTDLEEVRALFISRYGRDPGTIAPGAPSPETRQEA